MPYSKNAYHTPSTSQSSGPLRRTERKDWMALTIGIFLLGFLIASEFFSGILPVPGWIAWTLGVIGFLLVTTFLLKKFSKNAKTWYVFSMLETTRFNPVFDKLKNASWLEIAAEIGAIFGYGAVAADFFFGQKFKKKWQRAGLFLAAMAIMSGLSALVLGNALSNNPLIKGPSWIYQFFFGLFGLAGFLLYSLFTQAIDAITKIFAGTQACPGIAPIIPGIQTPNVPFFVPIEAWVSLVAILIIHEAAHGFLIRRHNLKMESSGLLLAGIIPIGAFVKPDENAMKKMDKRKQVQIMAAGPSSNLYSYFLVGILALLAGQFLVAPTIGVALQEIQRNSSLGVQITKVDQNTVICGEVFPNPAYGKIEPNSRLLAVNDHNISNLGEAVVALSSGKPQDPRKLLLSKNGKTVEKTLVPNQLGRLGIQLESIPNPMYKPDATTVFWLGIFQLLSSILFWFIMLSLFVAIANFLPVDPFDGGRLAKFMVAPYLGFLHMNTEDTERVVGRIFWWILLPLIILNALPLVL